MGTSSRLWDWPTKASPDIHTCKHLGRKRSEGTWSNVGMSSSSGWNYLNLASLSEVLLSQETATCPSSDQLLNTAASSFYFCTKTNNYVITAGQVPGGLQAHFCEVFFFFVIVLNGHYWVESIIHTQWFKQTWAPQSSAYLGKKIKNQRREWSGQADWALCLSKTWAPKKN